MAVIVVSMVSCYWVSVDQETSVEFEGRVVGSWVVCVGDRLGRSYMLMHSDRLPVGGFLVRRVVGDLKFSR